MAKIIEGVILDPVSDYGKKVGKIIVAGIIEINEIF